MNANDDKRIGEIPTPRTDAEVFVAASVDGGTRMEVVRGDEMRKLEREITALESQLAQRPVVANSATTAEQWQLDAARELLSESSDRSWYLSTPEAIAEIIAKHCPKCETSGGFGVAMSQASYALLDFNNKQPGCGFEKLAESCRMAAEQIVSLERELSALEAKLAEAETFAEIGRKWESDSSLKTWFPLTAERLEMLEAQHVELSTLRRQVEEAKKALEWYAGYRRPEDYLNDNGDKAQMALQQLAQKGEGK